MTFEGHSTAKGLAVQLKDIRKRLPLRVLSQVDWEHWTTWGYVVAPAAVPEAHIRRLVDLLWEFSEMRPTDPTTWSRKQLRDHQMQELNNSGMVEIYNHQYLWDNRQYPRVYDAFVDVWDRPDLWVAIDRANLNTPNRDGRAFTGFIHWDVDTSLTPFPIGVQGVLSLVDTDSETGGFQCVPELFRTLEHWISTQPADRNVWRPDNSLLAHGIRPNVSRDRVRMAQYISMYPAEEQNVADRDARVRSWREREAPKRPAFPGDPRDWERTRYKTATLTTLGEKLLGSRSWHG
ncbi:MAG: phytanoyl-CoA dioxygenase [Acidobacteria bacterium]|nr:MAG: phytanoyl-CoA dioxygenase [Acidobacteriota bacterium]